MATLEDVKWWTFPERGIGHVVHSSRAGWTVTLCGNWGPGYDHTPERPKRICRKCRENLAKANVIKKEHEAVNANSSDVGTQT